MNPCVAILLASAACAAQAAPTTAETKPEAAARRIYQATGVQGGLIVHLGCGSGRLTAALRISDRFLVHGLDADPNHVQAARAHVRAAGLYGQVAIDRIDGTQLPYIDNLVNLLVAADLGELSRDEVQRVLVPDGVAYLKTGDSWEKIVKPRSPQLGEWTHYLHDASGNAVTRDTVVGSPRRAQWIGSPRWSRHHDHMSSVSAVVSAGGRIFAIIDEGPTHSILLPPKWSLVARDAFNGTLLWRRSIENWHSHLWPPKLGPAQLPRRLVAVGDTVYVTLGVDQPVCALDAATGETIRQYPETRATEELIVDGGVLYTLVNPDVDETGPWNEEFSNYPEQRDYALRWRWIASNRRLVAIGLDEGKTLWQRQQAAIPLTLAARDGRLFYHDRVQIVCLDGKRGKVMWKSRPMARPKSLPVWFAPTFVVYDDVVLFTETDQAVRHRSSRGSLTALSAASGEVLWTCEQPPGGYNCPKDVLVAGGLVWLTSNGSGSGSGGYEGRDPLTGEVKVRFPPNNRVQMPHPRCYRAKATENYLLESRTGIELVDLQNQKVTANHWLRGTCLYGVMPCNGLIYAPPHNCVCYAEAQLNGFKALASAPQGELEQAAEKRFVRGPAYGQNDFRPLPFALRTSEDWPTYRHDSARSGATPAAVPAELEVAWQTDLGGRLSSPVVAGGRAFVACVDAHTLHALDSATGEKLWEYEAGARIDTPPTVDQDRVLFGSADGHVYCLRASDGVLCWRFRAARADRRLVAFEQLESVWPVPGSVLVLDGVVHCVAGRSMFLDGGLRYLRLDAQTGQKLSESILDQRHPDTGGNLQDHSKWPYMPTALPDILSSDGQFVYMRSQRFDLEGNRCELASAGDVSDQAGPGAHLFCPTGFLDDSWMHRAYWMFGKTYVGGAGGWHRAGQRVPAGRMLVFDDSHVYGYGRNPQHFPWTTALEYQLFAMDKSPKTVPFDPPKVIVDDDDAEPAADDDVNRAGKRRRRSQPAATRPVYRWTRPVPIQVRALVLADETLFLAGVPDVLDEEQAYGDSRRPEIRESLASQARALEGRLGGVLQIVSAKTGKSLAEHRLEGFPAFDGMAAARRRLYVSTANGSLLCFAGK